MTLIVIVVISFQTVQHQEGTHCTYIQALFIIYVYCVPLWQQSQEFLYKLLCDYRDREIQFFELSSFEPYCQISLLETVPLHMDFCSTGPDECMILYGDTNGCVNILVIKGAGECLRYVVCKVRSLKGIRPTFS